MAVPQLRDTCLPPVGPVNSEERVKKPPAFGSAELSLSR
jgi:hypothetical protein